MLGESNRLSQIEARKRLLVEQGEKDREQLAGVALTLKAELHIFTSSTPTLGSICSSASMLMVGLANLRRNRKPVESDAQRSWVQILNKGAMLVLSAWRASRADK